MTKQIITATASDIKYSLDGNTITEAIKRLQALGKIHGNDAVIDIGQECEPYDDSNREYAYVRLTVKREETDEEYERRTAIEKRYADQRAAADLAAYERVKKQMEKK